MHTVWKPVDWFESVFLALSFMTQYFVDPRKSNPVTVPNTGRMACESS